MSAGLLVLFAVVAVPAYAAITPQTSFDFPTLVNFSAADATREGFTAAVNGINLISVEGYKFRNSTVQLLSTSATGIPSGVTVSYERTAAVIHSRASVEVEIVLLSGWKGAQTLTFTVPKSNSLLAPFFTRDYIFDNSVTFADAQAADPAVRCSDLVPSTSPYFPKQSYPDPLLKHCAREGELPNKRNFYNEWEPVAEQDASYTFRFNFDHSGDFFKLNISSTGAVFAIKSMSYGLLEALGHYDVCENNCVGRGTCTAPVAADATCVCDTGFAGSFCQDRSCSAFSNCDPRNNIPPSGTCRKRDGTCDCTDLFGGPSCEIGNYQRNTPSEGSIGYWLSERECYPQVVVVHATGDADLEIQVDSSAGAGKNFELAVLTTSVLSSQTKFTIVPTDPSRPPQLTKVYYSGSVPIISTLNVANTSTWYNTAVFAAPVLNSRLAQLYAVGRRTLESDRFSSLSAFTAPASSYASVDSIIFWTIGAVTRVNTTLAVTHRVKTPSCDTNDVCLYRGCCASGVCACSDPSWTGSTCAMPVCVGNCTNHGACDAPDTCICDNGWKGSKCETPDCPDLNGCNLNNGNCSGPNKCDCTPGFFGADCSCMVNCTEKSSPNANLICKDGVCGCSETGFIRVKVGDEFVCSDDTKCVLSSLEGNAIAECEECSARSAPGWNPEKPSATCGFCNGKCLPGDASGPASTSCSDAWLFDTCTTPVVSSTISTSSSSSPAPLLLPQHMLSVASMGALVQLWL